MAPKTSDLLSFADRAPTFMFGMGAAFFLSALGHTVHDALFAAKQVVEKHHVEQQQRSADAEVKCERLECFSSGGILLRQIKPGGKADSCGDRKSVV